MRTYNEAYAAARHGSPFSNGTEGHAWTSNWCDRCVHDQSARRDEVKPDPANGGLLGCALLAVALMEKTPVEWIDQTANGHRLGDTYHCTEFRAEDEGGGDDRPPPPGPPAPEIEGQVDIFEVFAERIADEASQPQAVTR